MRFVVKILFGVKKGAIYSFNELDCISYINLFFCYIYLVKKSGIAQGQHNRVYLGQRPSQPGGRVPFVPLEATSPLSPRISQSH